MASFADIFNMPIGQGRITWGQLLGMAGQPTAQGAVPQGQQPQAQRTFSFQDFFAPASGQPLLYNTAPTLAQPQQRPQQSRNDALFNWLARASVQGGGEGAIGTEGGVSAGSDTTGDSPPDGGFE